MGKVTRVRGQYYQPETTLHEKLKAKGIEFYMLQPFRYDKHRGIGIISVECPYRKINEQIISIQWCKGCKRFLGSTTKTKNYWLCKKVKNE